MDGSVVTGGLRVLVRTQVRKDLYQANNDRPVPRVAGRLPKPAMAAELERPASSRARTRRRPSPRLNEGRELEVGKNAPPALASTSVLAVDRNSLSSGPRGQAAGASSRAAVDGLATQRPALPGGRRQAARQEKMERRQRVDETAKAARNNDGDAQEVLSRLYRKGKHGLARSKRLERYWKERAALNGKERVAYLSARQSIGFGCISGGILGGTLATVAVVSVVGLGIAAWPVLVAGIAVGLVAGSVAGGLWAHARNKAKKQARADAHTDHFRALAKNKPANPRAKNSLLAIGSAAAGIGSDALGRMLDDLYKVPENVVILDTAARLAEMGHIKKIHLRDPKGQTCGGHWNQTAREVQVNYADDEHWSRGALMHELTHAVAASVYGNEIKTYRTRAQKKQLKQAINAGARGRPDWESHLETAVATVMNEPFTQTAHYDHRDGWKVEWLVRIPQLLALDYATRAVFLKNHAPAWGCFQGFRADCADFLKRTGGTATSAPARAPAAPTKVLKKPSKAHLLASSILNEAVTRAFGNTLGSKHIETLRPEIRRLRKLLRAHPQLNDWSVEKRAQLRDQLAGYYAQRMSRSAGNRRQYGFADLSEAKLKAKVSAAVAALA